MRPLFLTFLVVFGTSFSAYSQLVNKLTRDTLGLEVLRESRVYQRHALLPRVGLDVGFGVAQYLKNRNEEKNTATLTLKSELTYQLRNSNFGFAAGFSYTDGPSSYVDVNQYSLTEHYSFPSIYGFLDYSLMRYSGINVKKFDLILGLGLNYTQIRGVQLIIASAPTIGLYGDRRKYRVPAIGPSLRFKAVRYIRSRVSVSFDWQQRLMFGGKVSEFKLSTANGMQGFEEQQHDVGGSFIHVGLGVLF
ncbi:hypothetical protein GYB22_03305 [bacterium]|nr:hypothetical protein [bacterium]